MVIKSKKTMTGERYQIPDIQIDAINEIVAKTILNLFMILIIS